MKIDSSTEEGVTIREEKAIKKVASGMLKLLCPDKRCEGEDISMALKVAVDGRQSVNALLSPISPEEFDKDKQIRFSLG